MAWGKRKSHMSPIPRSGCRDDYPFDLDGSLRFARPKTGLDTFPYPYIVGCIGGMLPMFDAFVWNQMIGKNPYGPGVTTTPLNLQWQMTVPGLFKGA